MLVILLIVNGLNTSAWHNLWLGRIPLIQQDEDKHLLCLPLAAKVLELLDSGMWNDIVHALPQSELKKRILNTLMDNLLNEDYIVWTPCSDGIYTAQ